MGLLVNGEWQDKWYDTESSDGHFERESPKMHNWVTIDGSPGPTGTGGFKAESGRYHLYVSHACPWSHRTTIFRSLKALEEHVSLSVVATDMLEQGWTFDKSKGSSGDDLHDFNYMHQVYTAHDPSYTGRVTVPVLWDKKTNQIVSNESSEIIQMFNHAFNDITNNDNDYMPDELHSHLNKINDFLYEKINNGVYRCGFATTQEAYEKAYEDLFAALDHLEALLHSNRYLLGSRITEADWRLFVTLIRFDPVYYGHFKCNKKRIEDYQNLANYLRELFQWPMIVKTVDFNQIKRHYYFSHTMINPTQIVPKGPDIDYTTKHNRDVLPGASNKK